MYALIFLAVTAGTSPAILGTYHTQNACQRVLRAVWQARMFPPGVANTPQTQQAVDIKLQYQRDFLCIPVDPD